MRGLGPDVVVLVKPTGVLLLDFFCPSIQLNVYVLLNPYLLFYLLLYLYLYVLDDASKS